MAGDTNSNIFINIDTSQAMAQLRALEKQLTALNRSLITGTKTAAQNQAKYAQGLLHNVNATGQWTASMVRMQTATEQFSTALDRSKLSLKEYFRYGMASTKTFGRFFGNEFGTVSKLVEKRVKTLQQQYVQLGRDAQGAMNALKFTPKNLNYRDLTTQLMIATQRQQILNKLLDDGSTKLLNFGKNTQWAGRQLMVGFTIPLMLLGTQAIRTFKEIETQVIRFRKVYGDVFTDPGQTEVALKNIRKLADEYTKYGLKVSETIKMAANAAAAGNTGRDLEQIVEQTNKLAVLGGVTQEKALETTIALKNAFKIGADDLDQTIDFLNAVENQTVVALDDLTEAIPRVAPVVQQLGGDIKDLAFFMAAMQEGGISAAQGANALKSGLASLINPSKKATEAAAELGINLKGIIEENQGNLRNTVVVFAKALQPLTDLQRSRIIEQIFGKFQFARISALLNNITQEGSQASRVLQLAAADSAELAILTKRELGIQAESSMNKFVGAVERLKAAMAPIGEVFAKTLTPAIEFISRMAERFSKLPEGVKKAVAIILAVVGGLGPVFLMTFGLLANALANTMKGFNLLRKGYQALSYGSTDAALKTQYLTQEELENISITNALYSKHEQLSAAYRLETTALAALTAQYNSAFAAMRNFASANPGLFMPGKPGMPPIRRAGGGTVTGPGTSTSDSIPAYLSDGEYVINAKAVNKYGVETFDAMNAKKFASGGRVTRGGIPRMFMGGWLGRMFTNMIPQTRRGIIQPNIGRVDSSALEGMTGAVGGRTRPSVVPATSIGSRNFLRFEEFGKDKVKFYLKDNPDDFFIIPKSKQPSLEQGLSRYFGKNLDKTDEQLYQNLLYQIRRPGGSGRPAFRGREVTSPSDFYTRLGKMSTSRNKNAPSEVRQALALAAEQDRGSVAAKTLSALNSDINFLKTTPLLNSEEKRLIKKYMTIDVAHIDPKDRFLWSVRTGSRDVGVINRALAYEREKFGLKGAHVFTTRDAQDFLNHLTVQSKIRGEKFPTTQKAAMLLLQRRIDNGFYNRVKMKDTDIGLQYRSYRTDPETRKYSLTNEYAMGGLAKPMKYFGGVVALGMPTSFASIQKSRMIAQSIDARVRSSRFRELQPTNFGVKIKDFGEDLGGHSFPIKGVGGIYRKPDGSLVVVKPAMDEKAALAEQRATMIVRQAHKGLIAPKQTIRTMIDPTDPARKRKFIVLESPYDERIAKGGKKFSETDYFKQLVASALRGDKDLSSSNVFGNVVADVGTAGVFGRASGARDYKFNMPSMAEQAMINLLGVKGGARKAFAENTAEMIRNMSPKAYHAAMIKEIDAVLPRLKKTIASFDLNRVEKVLYERMAQRLEAGKKVDWTLYHKIHSKVKPKKYKNGVFSVPGPKGAGDVVPAMLSPGESVIPTEQTQKYMPLIKSIVADNVPGYAGSNIDDPWDTPKRSGTYDKTATDRLQTRIEAKIDRGVDRFVGTKLGGYIDKKVREKQDRNDKRMAAEREAERRASKAAANETKKNTDASIKNTKTLKDRIIVDKKNLTEAQRLQRTQQGIRPYMMGYGSPVPNYTYDPDTKKYSALSSAERTNARQAHRMNVTQGRMGASMAGGMIGSMAMMYGMNKPDSFVGQNMGLIMGATLLTSILPMLNTPLSMLIASAIGLAAIFKMQSKAIKENMLAGQAQGRAMVGTTEELEALGSITNKVSITQKAAEVRRNRLTQITPVSMDFGNTVLRDTSGAGQKIKADFEKALETFVNPEIAISSLANKLATAVSQGVLTPQQAESLAVAITRPLNDAALEIGVRGKLIELIGPDGQNLTKDPLEVQLKIGKENIALQQAAFQNFLDEIQKQKGNTFQRKFLGGYNTKQEFGLLAGATVGSALGGLAGGGAFARQRLVNLNNARYLAPMSAAGTPLYGAAASAASQKAAMNATRIGQMGKISTALSVIRGGRTAGLMLGGGMAATGLGMPLGVATALISTVVFGALETAFGAWRKGQEKKAIAKAAGLMSGVTSDALKATQQSIDALNYEYNAQIESLKIRKQITTSIEEKTRLDSKINELDQKRLSGMQQMRDQQVQLLSNLGEQFDLTPGPSFWENINFFGGTGRGALKTKFLETFRESLNEKFKGNASQKAALSEIDRIIGTKTAYKSDTGVFGKEEDKKLAEKQRDKLTIEIQTLIDSDVMTPTEAANLLSSITNKDAGEIRKDLVTIIKTQGTEGLSRMSAVLNMIPKERNRKELYVVLKKANAKDFDSTLTAVETLLKVPSFIGIDINIETNKDDLDLLKQIGSETNAIQKFVGQKIPTKKMLLDLRAEDKKTGLPINQSLQIAIDNWESIQRLPAEKRLDAIITLTTIAQGQNFEEDLQKEVITAFIKTQPAAASYRDFLLDTTRSLAGLPSGVAKTIQSLRTQLTAFATANKKDIASGLFKDMGEDIYGLAPAKTPEPPKVVPDVDEGGGKINNFLDDLMMKLKLLKEGTLKWKDSWQGMMKALYEFGKINPFFDKQQGAIDALRKSVSKYGATLNTQIENILMGMDKKEFEDFVGKYLNTDAKGNIIGLKLTPEAAKRKKQLPPEAEFAPGFEDTILGTVQNAVEKVDIALYIEGLEKATEQTQNQVTAFDKITKGLYDAGDANATFIQQFSQGLKDGTITVAQLLDLLKDPEIAKGIATGARIFTKDGEAEEYFSNLKKNVKSVTDLRLTMQKNEVQMLGYQSTALQNLIDKEIDYQVALKIIEDDTSAWLIATKGVNEETQKIIDSYKAVGDALKVLENTKFFTERTNAIRLTEGFANIAPLLVDMGLSLEDINSILNNPTLAQAFVEKLADGKLEAGQLQTYINQIPQEKEFKLKIQLSTREGMEQEFNTLFSKAMEYYDLLAEQIEDRYEDLMRPLEKSVKDAQREIDRITREDIDPKERDIATRQRSIEMNISRKIDAYQEEISDLNKNIEDKIDRPIEILNRTLEKLNRQDEIDYGRVIEQYQKDISTLQRSIDLSFEIRISELSEISSDYSNDLAIMDEKVNEINDKYDIQQKALTQISEINQEIANQQKQQLGLADALSRGDISAAAQAAQDMRNSAASARSQNQSDLLNAAKEAEIDALRTAGGMTRKQIEKEQFRISQQIYQLEESREAVQAQILIIEDKIYAKEQERLKIQSDIRKVQDDIYALEAQKVIQQDIIYAKEQLIYALEEDREAQLLIIRGIEDQIYAIRNGSLKLQQDKLDVANLEIARLSDLRQAELDAVDAQREVWRDAQLAIGFARIEAGYYNDVIKLSTQLVETMKNGWLGVGNAILAATKALALYNATQASKATVVDTSLQQRFAALDGLNETMQVIGNQIAQSDSEVVDLELAIADAMEKGLDTTELEAKLAAVRASTEKLVTKLSETANAYETVESASNKNMGGYTLDELIDMVRLQLDKPSTVKPEDWATAQIIVGREGGIGTGGGGGGDMLMMAKGGLAKPKYMRSGGIMKPKYFDFGGLARGSDKIPAMLSPGEFIMSKYAVQNYGLDKMKAINNGNYENESVYNYSVNVNVKSDANPEEIARTVIKQIKYIDSQKIRNQRVG